MPVVTVVEGQVPQSKSKEFEESFSMAKKEPLPPGLISSSLLRLSKSPETYRIQTIWASREDLERMRTSTQKPKAIELFLNVGVQPVLEVYDVINNIR